MSDRNKENLLTASEVARYVYCQRAWGYDCIRLRQRRHFSRWGWIAIIALLLMVAAAILVTYV